MKRVITAVTALAMVFSLTACAKNEDREQTQNDGAVSAEDETTTNAQAGNNASEIQTALPFNEMLEGTTATALSADVTMYQVPFTDEINRDPTIDESHPEYIDNYGGDPYGCEMGIVFRNDRCLSIEVPDRKTGKTRTFVFGYITGECNRFLYLSPSCLEDGEASSESYYYVFDEPIGGGSILNLSDNINLDSCTSYVLERNLQEVNNASYSAPNAPGVVWHTGGSITDSVCLDVRVYRDSGDMVAILRLTLQMQNDGTYVLTGLENKDLLQNNKNTIFSEDELAYIIELANETYNDPDQVHFAVAVTSNYKLTEENCLIEFRKEDTSLYYTTFIPRDGVETTRTYMGQVVDALAVTFRFAGMPSQTFYYMIYAIPYGGEHGYYYYIGRDNQSFEDVKEMIFCETP